MLVVVFVSNVQLGLRSDLLTLVVVFVSMFSLDYRQTLIDCSLVTNSYLMFLSPHLVSTSSPVCAPCLSFYCLMLCIVRTVLSLSHDNNNNNNNNNK